MDPLVFGPYLELHGAEIRLLRTHFPLGLPKAAW